MEVKKKDSSTCKMCGNDIDNGRLFCDDDCMREFERLHIKTKPFPKNIGYEKGKMVYI